MLCNENKCLTLKNIIPVLDREGTYWESAVKKLSILVGNVCSITVDGIMEVLKTKASKQRLFIFATIMVTASFR